MKKTGNKFESDLYKYETKRLEFKDWSRQKTKYGEDYWLHLTAFKETTQHPGEEYFKVNLRQMRKRAEFNFRENVLASIDEKINNLFIQERARHNNGLQALKIMRIKHHLKSGRST